MDAIGIGVGLVGTAIAILWPRKVLGWVILVIGIGFLISPLFQPPKLGVYSLNSHNNFSQTIVRL